MQLSDSLTFRHEPDMTPMLDCTLQLMFFFMLTLNFSGDVQSELIRLPVSDIAKPAQGSLSMRLTVQALSSGVVLFGGDRMSVAALREPLRRECDVVRNVFKRNADDVTMVIRADRRVPVGNVQEIMRLCQETGFSKFVLRTRTP